MRCALRWRPGNTRQVYYELAAERAKRELTDEVAIVRVEQLAPFPFDLVMREMRRYPEAAVMWCAPMPALSVLFLPLQIIEVKCART